MTHLLTDLLTDKVILSGAPLLKMSIAPVHSFCDPDDRGEEEPLPELRGMQDQQHEVHEVQHVSQVEHLYNVQHVSQIVHLYKVQHVS